MNGFKHGKDSFLTLSDKPSLAETPPKPDYVKVLRIIAKIRVIPLFISYLDLNLFNIDYLLFIGITI
jgi:hypothetical protein